MSNDSLTRLFDPHIFQLGLFQLGLGGGGQEVGRRSTVRHPNRVSDAIVYARIQRDDEEAAIAILLT